MPLDATSSSGVAPFAVMCCFGKVYIELPALHSTDKQQPASALLNTFSINQMVMAIDYIGPVEVCCFMIESHEILYDLGNDIIAPEKPDMALSK